jgi:type I restriction enzyme R subunit
VLNELKFRGFGYEGAKQVLAFLKFGVPVKLEKERTVKFIRLLDYDHLSRNEFILSRQVTFRAGNESIRCDIVLFVNGIPLAIVECKNPDDLTTSWVDAFKDIKAYEQVVPDLFKYAQIGVAAEETAKYFPIIPFADAEDVDTCEWKTEGKGSLDSMLDMLQPGVLLDLIRNYLFVRIFRSKATKVIARYMQYRAAEKVVSRALAYAKGESEIRKGLVWHWQGSGKTLTMIFAALKLHHHPEMANPTLFFIVDREELEEQLALEFAALDIPKAEVIGSIADLRRVIRHDDFRGKRGMFIVLVHKFRPQELAEVKAELEARSSAAETIATRRNVVAFVDEGHRTQYGTLASEMRDTLKSAALFGFTGTPLGKPGRDTYREFSNPPAEPYLDKYFIADSINDGFTLKIAYQPRLERDVHLDTDKLEAFLEIELEDGEIPEERREDIEESVGRRLDSIEVFFENPRRIEQIAKDIAEHFRENLDGRFKAMVVAGDRVACVRYKRALDKLLPANFSEIVMHPGPGRPEVEEYIKELGQRFPGKDFAQINKHIVSEFKEEKDPRILIVTDMLLTGFDAPLLKTMYLDKPLKEHRLLQAIARTNRPLKGVKDCGEVIDYVGILKDLHRAFDSYAKEDIQGTLDNLETLRAEFLQGLEAVLRMFDDVPRDSFDRETMLKAVQALSSVPGADKRFVTAVRKLRNLFEWLGPDPIKVQQFQEFKWVIKVYEFYWRLTRQQSETPEIERYFAKTLKYIYRTTELEALDTELPEIMLGPDYLKALEEKVKSKELEAASIVFALNRFVLVERGKNPIFESLAEKIERLVKHWRERLKGFKEIYEEGAALLEEVRVLEARQKQLGFSRAEFASLLTLEAKLGKDRPLDKDVRELWRELKSGFYPGWTEQSTGRKRVEQIVRTHLRKYIREGGLTYDEYNELSAALMEELERYAPNG